MKYKMLLVCTVLLLLPRVGSSQSTLKSGSFRFEDLTSHKEANATLRPILDGLMRSGVRVDVHEVFLLPGSSPHHAHHHQQEELFLISEGEVEVTISGKTTKLGPGSAAFAASGDEHQIQNVGTRPAQRISQRRSCSCSAMHSLGVVRELRQILSKGTDASTAVQEESKIPYQFYGIRPRIVCNR